MSTYYTIIFFHLQYESDDVIASATPILFKSTQMYTNVNSIDGCALIQAKLALLASSSARLNG